MGSGRVSQPRTSSFTPPTQNIWRAQRGPTVKNARLPPRKGASSRMAVASRTTDATAQGIIKTPQSHVFRSLVTKTP